MIKAPTDTQVCEDQYVLPILRHEPQDVSKVVVGSVQVM